ncbi:MAG TPA: hypothetical protein VFO76_02925 [Candidatus Kapabacteria bacterium]|nr:hypothetical protein [Candidatus Kapabacteria bacterium]
MSPSGNPISDGTHSITVVFWDAPTGGASLYSETIPTTTNRGIFNVIIGGGNSGPIPTTVDFSKQYWLGVSVDGGAEMSPRTALTSAPYALNAAVAAEAKSVSSDATGIVTSINEVDGPIRIIGDSTTKVVQNGQVITISALPQGILEIQNTDGTIGVTNPKGPVVTLNINDTSITDKKLATGAVTTRTIADNAVTTSKIADGAVTGEKINQMNALTGQVLKWNGTTWRPALDDTTKIAPGTGIIITTDAAGNNVISTTLIGLPPGTLGQTLRHDGTNWVATSNLYNDGNRIGINTTTPGAHLDVNGNILLSNLTGPAGELRFQVPGPNTFITSFKAGAQTADLNYTLPPSIPIAEAILATDPAGNLSWRNALPKSVTVGFDQITTGTNQGQTLDVGLGSILKHVADGIVEANRVAGATTDGSSYAGRIAITKGATFMTVSLAPSVGCTPNSSVTVSLMDKESKTGPGNLVAVMVSDVDVNEFTVKFSADYPSATGFLTYLVVNP